MDRAGSPTLTELYQRHRAWALRIARRVLRDPDDAEDVVQDVFVRLWTQPDRFDGRSKWTTWLYRVLVNGSINSLRTRSRRTVADIDRDPPATPEDVAVSVQMRRLFVRALEGIDERQREVVWMREVRGMSYPEIAERLGIPQGTVKSTLHRGRSRAWELMLRMDEGIREPGAS